MLEKNVWKRAAAVLLAAACFFWELGMAGQAAAERRPVLRVGVTFMTAKDSGGVDAQAYDKVMKDYVRVLASYAGMDVEFVAGSIPENIARLERGEIDMIPDLVITPERSAVLDFSRLPTGVEPMTLYLHGGSARLDEDGRAPLRLGFLRGVYAGPVVDMAMQGEVLPHTEQMFDTTQDLLQADEAGALDGISFGSWPDPRYEPAVMFDAEMTYFAVKKGNTALLDRLSLAQDQLVLARPTFLADTLHQRESEASQAPLMLSRRERAYLRMHPQLRVLVVANERPYAYLDENGELAGAMKAVADQLASDLGIEIETLPYTDYESAYQAMQEGKADLLLNMFVDPEWGAERGLDQTASFMTSYFTAVTRRSGLPKHPVIAALDNRLAKELLQQHFPGQEIAAYPTIEACLEAVRQKKADVTYIRQSSAQYQTMRGDYPDLVASGRISMQKGIAMAVPKSQDSTLLRILDKEIRHMGDGVIEAYYAEENARSLSERSAFSYFYSYPQYVVLAIFAIAFACGFAFWRYRTMRHENEAHMQSLIDHDHATGLHNAEWLERGGAALIKHDRVRASERAVVVLRIVRPDVLIGTYGREAVIAFFQRLGSQLEVANYPELIGMRADGAEILCLTHPVTRDELSVRLSGLLRANEYLEVGSMLVRVPLQAGVCYLGEPPMDIRAAINDADIAAHGEEPVQFFSGRLQQETMLTTRMESLQRQALERQEFQIWYQPKYDLATRRCIGAEALVRWQSAELGFLPPGKFIALFESNGFISDLDFYNLEQVMKFQREAAEKGLPVVPISVNQSRAHMREQGYLRRMQALVDQYTTQGIELELTETAFDFADRALREHSLAVVAALHAMGFAIDMDDFGSGYSDLSLLNQLPLDVMKIDRSLLLASEGSERMCIVLQQMIDLGHALGMKVICEGIETEAQENLLRRCGCEYGQGYLYGKPMPRKEFEAFLQIHA